MQWTAFCSILFLKRASMAIVPSRKIISHVAFVQFTIMKLKSAKKIKTNTMPSSGKTLREGNTNLLLKSNLLSRPKSSLFSYLQEAFHSLVHYPDLHTTSRTCRKMMIFSILTSCIVFPSIVLAFVVLHSGNESLGLANEPLRHDLTGLNSIGEGWSWDSENSLDHHDTLDEMTIAELISDASHRKKPSPIVEQTLLVISLDGFRPDYLNRGFTPTLDAFHQNSTYAPFMTPCFPSLTFPNHFSIVTGKYPSQHGIVANQFYDHELKESFSYMNHSQNLQNKWWQAEPVRELFCFTNTTYYYHQYLIYHNNLNPQYFSF